MVSVDVKPHVYLYGDRGEGEERVKAGPRAPTRKTEEAVDCLQNTQNIKAVSPRHCVAASVLHNTVSTAVRSRVTKTMSVALPLRNNRSKRSPTF